MVSPQATQPDNTPHPGSRVTAQRAAIQTFIADELTRARTVAASERNDRNVLFAGQPTPDRMLAAERRVIAANAVEQHMAALAAAHGVKLDNRDFKGVTR